MSALLAIAFTASATVTLSSTATPDVELIRPTALKVLIAPTIGAETNARDPQLDEKVLAAFSGAFTDSAIDLFSWRNFLVVSDETAVQQISEHAKDGLCRSVTCVRNVASNTGSTHALFSSLTRLKDKSCIAFVSLYDLVKDKELLRESRDIKPCTADNVLNAAIELGKKAGDGPRAPVSVTLNVTPKELRSLDIPDIEDVEIFQTTEAAGPRKDRVFTLERALEIYKEKHMFVFEDDDHPNQLFIARNGRLITECEARRAASAPLPKEVREFCEGNDWEFAWLAFPVGVGITLFSLDKVDEAGGKFAFLMGAGITAASAILAILMNVDATDADDGEHYSSKESLEAIVARSNTIMREALSLTEAEVTVAGMRK